MSELEKSTRNPLGSIPPRFVGTWSTDSLSEIPHPESSAHALHPAYSNMIKHFSRSNKNTMTTAAVIISFVDLEIDSESRATNYEINEKVVEFKKLMLAITASLMTDSLEKTVDVENIFLKEALEDLAGVQEEAREEDYEIPSDSAINCARLLIGDICRQFPDRRLMVYATPDGEVAVHAADNSSQSVVLLCEHGESVLCITYIDGKSSLDEINYSDLWKTDLLKEALSALSSDN